MSTCAGPGCPRPVRAAGLCASHNRQRLRGRPLSPLRERPAKPLVMLGVRVSRQVREAARADPAAARAALEAWVRQAPAAVGKPKRKATRSRRQGRRQQ